MSSGPYEFISQYPLLSQLSAAEQDTHAVAETGEYLPTPHDVLLTGMLFFDIVFTGMPHGPRPGQEVWTQGMGSAPGGIANLAVALARLGLNTSLAAGFSTDVYGEWMWRILSEQEHIDLSHSLTYPNWHTPVTVSMAYDGDRAMVTHGHPTPSPISNALRPAPLTRAVIVDLGDPELRAASWWKASARAGAKVFADAGWDPQQEWDRRILDSLEHVYAFTPNAQEAMGYTRTDSPEAALEKLSELVPLIVVTDGARGAMAIDSSTGERASVPALPVSAIDPTGAGDVFLAALVLGTLREWPLERKLRFSTLCASLAVQQSGGSLAAPGWGDVVDWHAGLIESAAAGDEHAVELLPHYEFIHGCSEGMFMGAVRRAEATIAHFSDARPEHDTDPSD